MYFEGQDEALSIFGHLSFPKRNFSFLDSAYSTEVLNLVLITPSNPIITLPRAKYSTSFFVC